MPSIQTPPDALSQLATTIAMLDEDASREHVLEVWNRVKSLKARIADLDVMLREQVRGWIDEHGSIDIGDKQLYVATKKRTTVNDKLEAAEALLEAIGGDLTGFADALVAQPFKAGAMRKLLGESFGEHFTTREVLDVAQKPVKEVRISDRQYLKP